VAIVAAYVVDTSAAARAAHPRVAPVVMQLVSAGLVATCAALDFEALFSSRNESESLSFTMTQTLTRSLRSQARPRVGQHRVARSS
jgi:hypothetical protein